MAVTVSLLTAALLGALAVWVLAVRARDAPNRTLAALFLVFAGSALAFGQLRQAPTPDDAVRFSRIAVWYLIPGPLLFLVLAEQLFLPQPRPAWRRAGLLLGAALTFAALAAMAVAPGAFVGAPVPPPNPGAGWVAPPTILVETLTALAALAEAVVLVGAARAARAPSSSALHRRQAAMVGVAFGFLVAHAAGNHVSSSLGLPWRESVPDAYLVLGLVEGAAFFVAVRPLVAAFHGWGRAAAAGLLALPLLDGILKLSVQLADLLGLVVLREATSRPFWQMAFAVALAVAVVRYSLGGVAQAPRERAKAGVVAVAAAPFAAAGAELALESLGWQPLGLGLAGLALAFPLLLALAPPLHRVRGLAGRGVLLDARDPEVLAERVRVYRAALLAAAGPDGKPAAAALPGLRSLRGELGLTDRDHLLLGSTLEDARAPTEPGALLLGRYRIVRELGRGGFGEAFLARDERRGRDVVLKRLVGERRRDAAALRRFQREARLAGSLKHPNIVAVEGVEEAGGDAYLVMEYLRGGSLADRIAAQGKLAEPEAARIATDILAALEALHGQGILHRDVKPSNVLLDGEGRAKLGDFTIAKEAVSGETAGGGGPVGTFAYMAPEQARGLEATPRSDIYSLGATLHEALAGQPPIAVEGLGEFEAALRVVRQAPALPLKGCSRGMNEVLRRALAKDPASRFASAEAMRGALLDLAEPQAPTTRGTRAGSARPRPRPPA